MEEFIVPIQEDLKGFETFKLLNKPETMELNLCMISQGYEEWVFQSMISLLGSELMALEIMDQLEDKYL